MLGNTCLKQSSPATKTYTLYDWKSDDHLNHEAHRRGKLPVGWVLGRQVSFFSILPTTHLCRRSCFLTLVNPTWS